MLNNKSFVGLFVWCLSGSVLAQSQGLILDPARAQPQGVKLDSGLRVFPSLGLRYSYNSNFFASPNDEEGVAGVTVVPAVRFEKTTRNLVASIGADVEAADFENGSDDDYVDGSVNASFRYRAATRHRFHGQAEAEKDHDSFGLRRTEGFASANRDLDEYDDRFGRFGYRYGALNSLLNVAYNVSYFEREYDTNRDLGTRFLDYDNLKHEGVLYWHYSPKTSAVVKVSRANIDYLEVAPGQVDRSATEDSATVGLERLPSGKTSGEVFVGRLKRELDEPGFDEYSAAIWALDVKWQPKVTTLFQLQTGRTTDESYLFNSNFVDSRGVTLNWGQKWNHVATTSLAMSFTERDFENLDRTDDYSTLSFDLSLRVSREIHVTVKAAYSDRDSTFDVRDYDQQYFSVGFIYAP